MVQADEGVGGAAEVTREVQIDARPETVFALLTDPAQYVRWMGLTAEIEPHPGGRYRVDVTGNDIARGEFVEVTAPSRLVLTWGWEGEGHPVPPGSSRVEITLTPAQGGTLLRLVHRGLPDAAAAGSHGEGWTHFLERLAVLAGGGDPGPDPWLAAAPD